MQRIIQAPIVAEWDELDDHTTTSNDWAAVGTWRCVAYRTKHLSFAAADNDLNVRVVGSLDGGETFPLTAETSFAVTAGTTETKTITTAYTDLRVEVDPAVDGAHGTLSVKYFGASY